jgi:hypothetical protein
MTAGEGELGADVTPGVQDDLIDQETLRDLLFGGVPDVPDESREAFFVRTFDPSTPDPDVPLPDEASWDLFSLADDAADDADDDVAATSDALDVAPQDSSDTHEPFADTGHASHAVDLHDSDQAAPVFDESQPDTEADDGPTSWFADESPTGEDLSDPHQLDDDGSHITTHEDGHPWHP